MATSSGGKTELEVYVGGITLVPQPITQRESFFRSLSIPRYDGRNVPDSLSYGTAGIVLSKEWRQVSSHHIMLGTTVIGGNCATNQGQISQRTFCSARGSELILSGPTCGRPLGIQVLGPCMAQFIILQAPGPLPCQGIESLSTRGRK